MCPKFLTRYWQENTLMTQRNHKKIVKLKLLGSRKSGTLFKEISQPILYNDILRQEYFSINIASRLLYESCLKILMQFSCKLFILLLKFSI